MPVIAGFSDDQIALAGCLAALVVCGGLMSLSYYLRPRDQRELDAERADTLAFRREPAQNDRGSDAGRRAA